MVLSNSEIRKSARIQLKGNWGKPIAVVVLYFFIVLAASMIQFIGTFVPDMMTLMTLIGVIATIIVSSPLMVGMCGFSLKFMRNENPNVEELFVGFKYILVTIGTYLWYTLWVMLWNLLFFIPGIIKSLSYSMIFFIIYENPKVGIRNAMNLSKKMTKGYKGKIFVLFLSFIGWCILATITLGIGYLWLGPYMQMSIAKMYDELKRNSIENGVCTEEDFTRVCC